MHLSEPLNKLGSFSRRHHLYRIDGSFLPIQIARQMLNHWTLLGRLEKQVRSVHGVISLCCCLRGLWTVFSRVLILLAIQVNIVDKFAEQILGLVLRRSLTLCRPYCAIYFRLGALARLLAFRWTIHFF